VGQNSLSPRCANARESLRRKRCLTRVRSIYSMRDELIRPDDPLGLRLALLAAGGARGTPRVSIPRANIPRPSVAGSSVAGSSAAGVIAVRALPLRALLLRTLLVREIVVRAIVVRTVVHRRVPLVPAPASALARPPPQNARYLACQTITYREAGSRDLARRDPACRGTGLHCIRGSVARGDIARHLIRQLRTRESPTTARTHASMDDFCLVTIRRQNR
jgi:hypothetical protein